MRIHTMVLVAALASMGAFQLGGCAATSSDRSTGQVVDDSSITARVKTAIARDASLGTATDVNVTTSRGVVQLSGFVPSEQVAQRAEKIAGSVEGVRSVKNDLRVSK